MTAKQQEMSARELGKCRDLMRLQHKARSTVKVYLHWIGSYIDFLILHGRDFADSRGRMEGFLTRLANRNVSASTQNQAFNALLYLYEQVRKERIGEVRALRAKRPARHRQALSREVTLDLLGKVQDVGNYPTRLVVRLLYACGLRVCEPLNLRVKDVQVAQSRLVLRDAKGGKDRVVRVPCALMGELQAQLRVARIQWEADVRAGLPVALPEQLARKYARAGLSWQWAWVFPAHSACEDKETGAVVRWRMHEVNVQRAMREAATPLGLEYVATPHVLRHCYATHVLDRGCNIRDLQEALGHKNLETTQGYVHAHAERVVSPMEF